MEVLFRKAFIRLNEGFLEDTYIPLVQYATKYLSTGKMSEKRWKVLQGPYGNYQYTLSQFELVRDYYRRYANDECILKANGNPFTVEELDAWLDSGFKHSCSLQEYLEVGNQLKAYYCGRVMKPVRTEAELRHYISQNERYANLEFGFWNWDFHTPKCMQKTHPARQKSRVRQTPGAYYVLASDVGYWKTYFCKQLKSSISKAESRNSEKVRRFKSEAEAAKYLASNSVRLKQSYYNWYPLKISAAK